MKKIFVLTLCLLLIPMLFGADNADEAPIANQEIFNVYYDIDSVGVNIYSERANVIVNHTTDTTVVFSSWTSGPLDITEYTVLGGDQFPGNNTVHQTTTIARAYWEVLPDMPYTTSGPYAGYSLDASNNAYIHVFGGNPGPQNDHYIWDQQARTWSTGTPLPQGANYGGHCSIDNRIYMIGAWAGPAGYMTIYDADSDTYTTKALPGGTITNPGIAVKDNNLIYIVGGARPPGWTGTTIVNVYDVAGDSFFTNVTQLPSGDEKMSAGTAMIAGDTIIVAAGINAAGTHEAKVLLGAIDPANPANITWTTGPSYPPGACYRLSGADWEGIAYFTGGSDNITYFTATVTYVPGTGWVTLPDKPIGCSNFGCVMAPVDTNDTDFWAEGMMYACGDGSAFQVLHTGDIINFYIAEHLNDPPFAFSCRLMSTNPIVDKARFQFTMPISGPVRFTVYDVTGRTVRSGNFSNTSCGTHTLVWNCNDNNGIQVSAGTYFYRLEAAGNVATGKLIVVQ